MNYKQNEKINQVNVTSGHNVQKSEADAEKAFLICADWSIHDKNDGNPHVHLLVTMRPFNSDHSWGNKEVKDCPFLHVCIVADM